VANTAGAGDAHLAGILVGLAAGLSLAEAQELGTLVAALSVTSADTINFDVERRSLAALAHDLQAPLTPRVHMLLGYSP
jgi:sugar/nucleoside kinase (ribokinase family)